MFSPAIVTIFISPFSSFLRAVAIPVSSGAVFFLGEGSGNLVSTGDWLPFTTGFSLMSDMVLALSLPLPCWVNLLLGLGDDGGFGSGSGYGGGALIGCNSRILGDSGGVLIGCCSCRTLGDSGGIGDDCLMTLGDCGGVGSRDGSLDLGDGGGAGEVWEIAGGEGTAGDGAACCVDSGWAVVAGSPLAAMVGGVC